MKKILLLSLLFNFLSLYTMQEWTGSDTQHTILVKYNPQEKCIHAILSKKNKNKTTYVTKYLLTKKFSERTTSLYKPSSGRPYYPNIQPNSKHAAILKQAIDLIEKHLYENDTIHYE